MHSVARTPRTFGSPCYGIQVSQGRPLFWCTKNVEQGRVNCRSLSERGMTGAEKSYNLMCRKRLAFGGTHPPGISGVRATEYKFPFRSSCLTLCAVRYLDLAARTPPAFQESELPNPSFLFGVRAAGRRFPCPGGTSFRDTAPGDLREAVPRNASIAGETAVLGHDGHRPKQISQ